MPAPASGRFFIDARRNALINEEIGRLERLRESQNDLFEAKMMPVRLASMLGILPEKQKEDKLQIEKFYKASDVFIVHKIDYWKQYLSGEMKSDMLEKMNETMTEWLELGWAYLGQEGIEEESKLAKEEFEMFKRMISCKDIKIVEPEKPAKKKTRRAGKRHKKNKTKVEEE